MNNEMNEHINDLFSAVKEDGITAVVESETFKQSLLELVGIILSGPAAPIVGSIIAASAPRINGIFLSYKQHRFERNIKSLLSALSERVTVLENNYQKINDKMKDLYNGVFVEMLLDSIVDEPQEEKIEYNANAFVALMTNEANENIMNYFFNTLSELTVLDVDILCLYSQITEIDWDDIQQKHGVEWDHIQIVKEKLVRLGLLFRKSDRLRDKNIEEIVEYLIKVDSDSKKNKPKGVKFPHSIKKLGHSESYGITNLGMSFLNCIGKDDSEIEK